MKAQIKKVLRERMEKEIQDNTFHNLIHEVLKEHDGKKITQRLITAIEKKVPIRFYVNFQKTCGLIYVVIREVKNHDNYSRHLIGYPETPYIDAERFDSRFDSCSNDEVSGKRITMYKDSLKAVNLNKLTKAVEKYLKIKAELDVLLERTDCAYLIHQALELK